MKTIEIYFDDLQERKQKEVIDVMGDNGNYDIFPIATIQVEADESFACPFGGDETDDCADCSYSGDYHFVNGECVERDPNEK